MKTITITTEPISVNQLYTGRRFLTPKGRETKNANAWEIKTQWQGEPIEGDITLNILFYFKDNRKDIDGCLKALLDSLEGILYLNDRQITELHVYKQIDKANPRTEVQVV